MHDARGRELMIGDRVLVPAVITSLGGGEDYCNVGVTTEFGRRPDGIPESMSAINTGVLLRNRDIDDNQEDIEAPKGAGG